MGGDQTLFILVMVALAIVLVGTFVLRPSFSAMSPRDGRTLYYVVRLGIVLFGLIYGSHHSSHRATNSFTNPAPSSTAGPKTMEFNWPTTQGSR